MAILAHPEGMGICPSVLDNYKLADLLYWHKRLEEINEERKKQIERQHNG